MTSPETNGQLTALAGAAAEGRLRLASGVAESCSQACGQFLDSLADIKKGADRMSTISAYGTLGSAQALGGTFEQKAVGAAGFDAIIQQHIETVKQLQDVFNTAGKAYAESDQSNAQGIGAAGSGI